VNNKKRAKLIAAVLVLLLFLVGSRFGWWNGLKNSFHFLTYRSRTNVYNWLNHSEAISSELEKELAQCQAEVLELQEENNRARRLLGTEVKPDTKFHLLKIIAFQPETILLSNQKNIDLHIGDFVVSGPFLVGKVNKVQGKVNQARLLSHPEIDLPVKVWDSNPTESDNSEVKSQGILKGRAEKQGNLIVEDVLFKDQVEKDNWVGAVSSTGDVFLIGQVQQVETSKDKVFETLTISWSVEPKKLLTVGIVAD
jgi:cell shape-determining protein MreC